MLTVLTVGYPLSSIGPDAVGGAEQIASAIDAALVAAGHRSLVIAPADSICRGQLIPLPVPAPPFDTARFIAAHAACRSALAATLSREHVDVLHFHGTDFPDYLPGHLRAVATLHRWPDWYPPAFMASPPPHVVLQCVSEAQHRACPQRGRFIVIPNGVDTSRWYPEGEKTDVVVVLGRICPEKAQHLAIDAAERAGVPLVLAGAVFPYEAHLAYFRTEIEPRLSDRVRFIGAVAGAAKRQLLAAARCVMVPSLVLETSSLAAMEALACGTPVIALRTPALEEVVDDGRTGPLVDDANDLAAAIRRVGDLDPRACRDAAVQRFSARRMTDAYLELYERIAAGALVRT